MKSSIATLIDAERKRQSDKWEIDHAWGHGDCSSMQVARTTKTTVLMEEAGEVARAVLDNKLDGLVDELVQVAAVAVAWIEAELCDIHKT